MLSSLYFGRCELSVVASYSPSFEKDATRRQNVAGWSLLIRSRYYEGGVSSVYFWDLDDGFAGVVLLKKSELVFAIITCTSSYTKLIQTSSSYSEER